MPISQRPTRLLVCYYIILNLYTPCRLLLCLALNSDSAGLNLHHHHIEPTEIPKIFTASTYTDAKNYASAECAKVVEINPEAKKASHILNEMTDEYMLNPCKTKIWFVIELCESIKATHIQLANYELFSSTPKDFTVYFSDTYPALDWKLVGKFTANDSRTMQAFDLNQVGFGKFIRVELHSHYGNEHYCPISQVRVFGASMVDDYTKSEQEELKKNISKELEPRTSAYRVYHDMMIETYRNRRDTCGLLRSSLSEHQGSKEIELTITNEIKKFDPSKPLVVNVIPNHPSLPTQQPQLVNKTTPLKPSIFVDLSNKVKALETLFQELSNKMKAMESSLRTKIEDIDKRTDSKFDRLIFEVKSFSLVGLACIVYIVVLELL